jgi:DHA2 family multidrug resistance protein-like MFS transporter
LTLGSLLMSLMFALVPSDSAVHWGLAAAALAALAGSVASLLRSPARARAA